MAQSFKEGNGVLVPSAKRLNHEGLEVDSFGAAIGEMSPDLRSLSHLDGGAGGFRGAKDDGVLSRRDDANIEGDLPSIDPVADENVGWT